LVLFLRRLANRNMSLYAQLDVLERCGIVPNPGVGIPDLLAIFGERQYETDPFRRLLIALGGESNDLRRVPLCDSIWRLQVGCIAGPGDYERVAHRMALLAGDALPISDVRDHFELGASIAWLHFRLADSQFDWPARIRERWIDPSIVSRFVALLEAQPTDKRFFQLDVGGQDVLIGCAAPARLAGLRRRTGLRFEWLG
jgi:hypothetical protein